MFWGKVQLLHVNITVNFMYIARVIITIKWEVQHGFEVVALLLFYFLKKIMCGKQWQMLWSCK
jgi:hypothetical protein